MFHYVAYLSSYNKEYGMEKSGEEFFFSIDLRKTFQIFFFFQIFFGNLLLRGNTP